MAYSIKDIGMAAQGVKSLGWAEQHMPTLMMLRAEVGESRPLKGMRIAALLHITKETGALARVLKHAGAMVNLAASNPLSTQDDVAAALAKEGIGVFARRGESSSEYNNSIKKILKTAPDIVIDDGADLHAALHQDYKSISIIGGTEETTTGVTRLKAMERQGVLRYPVIAVNNAHTKYLFDNRYGTGQSTADGIMRATNVLIAGKRVVVAGYGWVGRGIAMRMHGLGAKVIVTEVDPYKALEAVMDGFEVMPMCDASAKGDLFITATGDRDVITATHMKNMKNGSILSNSGHFDVEIDVKGLGRLSSTKRQLRNNLTEYTLKGGKKIYLLSEGRLVNLASAEGHPSEVMDLSFSNQFLSAVFLCRNRNLEPRVYNVFEDIDMRIAKAKLRTMDTRIDTLTKAQKAYMASWSSGT